MLGALCSIANDARITLRLTSADESGYFALNILAASLVLCGLTAAFNAVALVIHIFFLTMRVARIAARPRRRGTWDAATGSAR